MNHDSPRAIKATLNKLGITLKKRWGQNFLINRGARKKIAELLNPSPGQRVWEIGPGLGALTDQLALYTDDLFLFEIDRKLVVYLESLYNDKFRVIGGDFLRIWKDQWSYSGLPDMVAGNLPYNSASAIIASFAEEDFRPRKMVFTVQRELAHRMTANPGEKNYSAFSVVCRFAFKTIYRGNLSPGSFYPEPGVQSAMVEITAREDLPPVNNRELFFRLVKALFSSRRKTLRNNLLSSPALGGYDRKLLIEAAETDNLKLDLRSEVFEVDIFIRLANRIDSLSR